MRWFCKFTIDLPKPQNQCSHFELFDRFFTPRPFAGAGLQIVKHLCVNPLKRAFFTEVDLLTLCRRLLGQHLVTNLHGERCIGRIVEVEAYRAPEDKACHAYGNRRTSRTEPMFWRGGHAYVYLCYGIHHLFNIVTGPAGRAEAVLVRAVEPVAKLESMMKRRKMDKPAPRLTAGPGCLSQAMGITTALSGQDMLKAGSPVWLESGTKLPEEHEIVQGPRIGVDYAAECAAWPWRFAIQGNPWLSKAIP